MRKKHLAAALALTLTLAACEAPSADQATTPTAAPSTSSTGPGTTGTVTTSGTPSASAGQNVVGTVVRFTAGSEAVDVTIGQDSPATRDFLSMLPLNLTLEEFNGREKIADLPRPLKHEGSPGSDPENGHLIYFVPWGNLGFYYNAEGVGFSDQTLHLGTYNATTEQLERLEGREATVQVVP